MLLTADFYLYESGQFLVVGGLTPVIHISKGCVDELLEASCLFSNVQQHRDCVIVTIVQVQKCFWQTRLPCRRFQRKQREEHKSFTFYLENLSLHQVCMIFWLSVPKVSSRKCKFQDWSLRKVRSRGPFTRQDLILNIRDLF